VTHAPVDVKTVAATLLGSQLGQADLDIGLLRLVSPVSD
jgi:hypothetical protein